MGSSIGNAIMDVVTLGSSYQTRDPLTGQRIAPDPIAAALRDGQREVILWLRHEIAQHNNNKQPSPEQSE